MLLKPESYREGYKTLSPLEIYLQEKVSIIFEGFEKLKNTKCCFTYFRRRKRQGITSPNEAKFRIRKHDFSWSSKKILIRFKVCRFICVEFQIRRFPNVLLEAGAWERMFSQQLQRWNS